MEHRVPQILYGRQQRALPYAVDRDLAERIARKKPVIVGYLIQL
jgi:ribosomal protein L25 (general stress protein Ctc)